MSKKVLRTSFWRIVEHMVDTQYHEHVYFPRTEAELHEVESRFAKMGMPGAFSDVDGVQLAWHKCPSVYAAMNTGKEGYPTLGFLEFVGPNGEVQHIHGPEPGTLQQKLVDLPMAKTWAQARLLKKRGARSSVGPRTAGKRGCRVGATFSGPGLVHFGDPEGLPNAHLHQIDKLRLIKYMAYLSLVQYAGRLTDAGCAAAHPRTSLPLCTACMTAKMTTQVDAEDADQAERGKTGGSGC